MHFLPISKFKWLLSMLLTMSAWFGKRFDHRDESQILGFLEESSQPLTTIAIRHEFIKRTVRGVHSLYLWSPSQKPPLRVKLRHYWRFYIKREVPSEEKLRDLLRNLKSKGVDFAGNDSWILRHYVSAPLLVLRLALKAI
jgi:hypothetical protein